MNIINQVRDFVEKECKKPTSKYGYEPFDAHFIHVVNYANQLAEKMGGDKEIVTIAAWLHEYWFNNLWQGRSSYYWSKNC